MRKCTNSFLREGIQIYIRKRKWKTPIHKFLMIHHQLIMVFLKFSPCFFPSSSFFLSDFISWPFPALVSCFQITLLPKSGPPLSSSFVYPPLLSVFCPHGDHSLPSILSSQASTSSSFSSSFLPPKTRPMPQPYAIPPPYGKWAIAAANRVI